MPDSTLLFFLVFISQISIISFYYPRKLMKLVKSTSCPTSNSYEVGTSKHIDSTVHSYALSNYVLIVTGLILIALFVSLDLFESITAVLLAIGIFFFLQLSPLVILGMSGRLSDLKLAASRRDKRPGKPLSSSKLFDFVSPLLVGIACILFFTYLIIELAQWNGDWDTQLLKIVIFVASNLFFAAVIARKFYALRRGNVEEGIKRHQDFKKVASTLIYISIGLSIYFFAKQLLFDFDLHQLRPIMMSAFLQLLATLSFNSQLRYLGLPEVRGASVF